MEEREPFATEQPKFVSRKEKRKALKKDKRKQTRKELAEKARAEEEARMNDPEEQRKIQLEEEREKERLERERKEFEERERIFLEELERKKMEEEEEEQRNVVERELKLKQEGVEEGSNEDDEWEYVEGPPEIIWQGNEIIVKKNKVRVKKKDTNQHIEKEDPNRPTSNPLPPQSEAYAAYKNAPMTSTELLETVAQQVPNFGTEQDKAHCPFHIKTGACRFGLHCNRVHYYPDKSSTLLIKNMYNGPGLAWEQDEGLENFSPRSTMEVHGFGLEIIVISNFYAHSLLDEVILYYPSFLTSFIPLLKYTDEEVEQSYEEFYEDVHTEFLKFGEIINFKVCRNGSFHLRGNVYVQYKSLDSAVMAHNSVHGRYFAGKQVKCEFVSLTRWKVAICGEYMKSRLKTCSRGSACNFLHCFSNPGGDYEWADCDKPPPRYWAKKMTALFGYSDDTWHDKQIEQPSPKDQQHSSKIVTSDRDSYHYKRRRSIETNQHGGGSGRSRHEENHARKSRHHEQQKDDKSYEDETEYKNNRRGNSIAEDNDSGGDRNTHRRHRDSPENRSSYHRRDYYDRSRSRTHGSSSDEDLYTKRHVYKKRRSRHRENISESSNDDGESDGAKHEPQWRPSSEPSETHKERKTDSTRYHRRSRRHDDEVDHRQSKNEPNTKKQKRRYRKSASLHRYDRSRSRDSGHLSDKIDDRSDRWDPDGSPNEHGKHSSNKVDCDISDDGKPKDLETRSGSLEEESKNRQSRDRDHGMREKR